MYFHRHFEKYNICTVSYLIQWMTEILQYVLIRSSFTRSQRERETPLRGGKLLKGKENCSKGREVSKGKENLLKGWVRKCSEKRLSTSRLVVVFFTSAKCRIPSYLLRLITLDYYVQSAVVCMLDTGAVESNFGIFREQ